MAKKILFTCNTCYQLIVAIQMSITVFKENDVDCIITDIVPDFENVARRLKGMKVFSSVFEIKAKGEKYDGRTKNQFEGIFLHSSEGCIYPLVKRASEYSLYLFANIGGFSVRLGRSLKRFNPEIQFGMFEDGASSYSLIYGSSIVNSFHPSDLKEKVKKIFGASILSFLKYYYVFYPDLMVWDFPENVKLIPLINADSCEPLRTILNTVFDYDNVKDKYEEKIIFFEESYFTDGIETNDIELVNILKKKYGINNILVKAHPRASLNRFGNLGFKTNCSTSLPWEVVVLNMTNLEDKILVTMTSSALINTFLIRQSCSNIIFAYDCLRKIDNKRVKNTIEVIEKLICLYPDKVSSSLSDI